MKGKRRGVRSPRPSWLAALFLLTFVTPAAGQWPAGAGRGWGKLTLMSHETTARFDDNGDEQEFFAGGESASRAVFLDVLVGVHDHLDLWLQIPWFDLSFDDAARDRDVSGFGDARAFARWNLGHHLLGGVPLSLRAGVKAPLSDFPIDAEVIPVGEGQWDVEVWLEGGHSFWPVPAYAVTWVGYRWRLENGPAQRDPGDERLFLVEVGLTTAPIGAKIVVDGLLGRNPVIQGIEVGQGRREIVVFQPELVVRPGRSVTVSIGLRQPLHGRSFPAGRQYLMGVFVQPWG